MDNSCMSLPWVEKYRPDQFKNIILDNTNRIILQNILKTNRFPNLLFYGPPGTGKTTTIMNLIKAYQKQNNQEYKGLVIHLNASDERGIDIIRNQISTFVNSSSLFKTGTKFVILDEVDYMTKTAQYALRYLLQRYIKNVRFCLICNYISKLDIALQTEFVILRFNQLPVDDILKFLEKVSRNEKLKLNAYQLSSIQKLYLSDIRSMINYMQTNQDIIYEYNIIEDTVWDNLINQFKNKMPITHIKYEIYNLSATYNIGQKNLIKDFINYIITNNKIPITAQFLTFIENIMHTNTNSDTYLTDYLITKMIYFFEA